jgi:hypothetical protein
MVYTVAVLRPSFVKIYITQWFMQNNFYVVVVAVLRILARISSRRQLDNKIEGSKKQSSTG